MPQLVLRLLPTLFLLAPVLYYSMYIDRIARQPSAAAPPLCRHRQDGARTLPSGGEKAGPLRSCCVRRARRARRVNGNPLAPQGKARHHNYVLLRLLPAILLLLLPVL